MQRQYVRRIVWGTIFVAPALLVYGLFLLYPLVASLVGSLYSWDGLEQKTFAGLANFGRLFSEIYKPRVIGAFGHSVVWFAGIMILQNVVAFCLAYILYLTPPGYKFFRMLFFVPALLSPIVVGALWRLLLHPMGAVNQLLGSVGVTPIPWLGRSEFALLILILVDAWNWMGFPILVFLAAMNDIPQSVTEAAELDGATGFQRIRMIILPLIVPAISVITILTFINTINTFDIVYIMEGVTGNPNYATDVLSTLFYRLAFGSQGGSGITEIGLSLALASLMLLFLLGGVGIALRLFRRKEVAF